MLEPVIFTLATVGTALPLVDPNTFLSLVATGSAMLAFTQDPVVQQCFITTLDFSQGAIFLAAGLATVGYCFIKQELSIELGAIILHNFNAAKEHFGKFKKGVGKIFLKKLPVEIKDSEEKEG